MMRRRLHRALERWLSPTQMPAPPAKPKPENRSTFEVIELSRCTLPQLRIALLGTCVSEHLAQLADKRQWDVKHWLMDSGAFDAPPQLDLGAHDGIVVHLTLRTLLGRSHPLGDGDLFHLRADREQDMTVMALETLAEHVETLLAKLPNSLPVFFLAFAEPSSTQGLIPRPEAPSLAGLIRALNQRLAQALAPHSHTFYVETNDLLRFHGDSEVYDGYVTHTTHGSFLPESESGHLIYSDIWNRIGGLWRTYRQLDQIKLIITDLDNTLWKGVAAEADEIVPWHFTEGWPLGYAEALLACKARGILLAIASKNDESFVQAVFPKIWKKGLALQDFCSVKVGWRPKPEAVAEILAETNLLPEHVLFIDDSPLEIAEVTRVYPQLRTLTLPQQRWRHVLFYAPETQRRQISAESEQRTALVRAKIARDQARNTTDRDSFLASLQLAVELAEISNTSHPRFIRAFELLNKTNQFNTTGQRWSEAELRHLFAEGGWALAVTAQDQFADHGLIGLALVRGNEIVQVVLSCRVFGLGIETALLHRAQTRIAEKGASHSRALWRDTGRNQTSARYYVDHGWKPCDNDPEYFEADIPPGWPGWIASLS